VGAATRVCDMARAQSSEILALLGSSKPARPALDPSDFPSLGRSGAPHSLPPLTAGGAPSNTGGDGGQSGLYGLNREDARFALHKSEFANAPSASGRPPSSVMLGSGGGGGGGSSAGVTGNFGLMGLMGLIKSEDSDRTILAGGMDLTTLGLNLNSNESLQTTFSSPWTEDPSQSEFIFSLPASFPSQVIVRPEIMEKVSLETLFVCFYSMPREILQCLAAQELVNRSWRLHEEHRLWFSQGKNGTVVFFDVLSFERRVFPGRLPDGFESGFIAPEVIANVYRSVGFILLCARAPLLTHALFNRRWLSSARKPNHRLHRRSFPFFL